MLHRGLPRASDRARPPLGWLVRASWLCFALVILLVHAAGAVAQTPEAEAEAKQLFQRGVEASDAGRWAEAADFFQRSREQVERPNTLFNLVGLLHRLGRYREGLEVGAAYLRAPSTAAERDKRTEVERLLADMELAVGVLRLSVVPRTARVTVDGRPLPLARDRYELTIDPGRHQLSVEAQGHEPQQRTVVVERGARLSLDLTLLPVSATAMPPATVLPADEAHAAPSAVSPAPLTKRQKRIRRALWATGGILVAGGIAAFMIAGAATDEEDPEPTGGTTGITLPL
jgi:hypothetical protein